MVLGRMDEDFAFHFLNTCVRPVHPLPYVIGQTISVAGEFGGKLTEIGKGPLKGLTEMDNQTGLSKELVAEIECLLREISVVVKRKGREILNEFPITPPQFTALLWLNDEGDMTIGDLSQKMYLACSTMTDLVDRMEKNELVERVRDDRDRRVVRIHLLQKGKEIIGDVMETRRSYLSQVLSRFSEEEVREMAKHLSLLHHGIK